LIAFFIVFVGRHWFPREFTGLAQLVVSAHKAVMVEVEKAGAIEVRKGLYVSFESELSQAKTDRVIATIREEDEKVAEIFPVEVPEPIFIKVTLQSKPGKEAGTEQRGAYHVDGHKAWGMHSIEASLIGVLNEHVVAHELTHMYAHLINPAINLLMDEGLAHYVQDTFDEPDSIDRGRLETCRYASARHWISSSSRSRSDTMASRALGFVVVRYLHREKDVPLKDIPLLLERELPSVDEFNTYLRLLQMEVAKQVSLAQASDDVDLSVLVNAYLAHAKGTRVGFDDTIRSPREAQDRFQDLMDLSVDHLRWLGLTDEVLREASAEELLAASRQAVEMIDQRLDQIALRWGARLFGQLPEGIDDDGLDRLIRNAYSDLPEGKFQKAMDQGWARVYASKRLPNRNLLMPEYSAALLTAIQEVTGPPSPSRYLLHEWQTLGVKEDRIHGK
jgi:hypothetical protein